MTELLELLKDGKGRSVEDLAVSLHTSPEDIRRQMEFLEHAGYIRRVETSSCSCGGCGGSTKTGHGGNRSGARSDCGGNGDSTESGRGGNRSGARSDCGGNGDSTGPGRGGNGSGASQGCGSCRGGCSAAEGLHNAPVFWEVKK